MPVWLTGAANLIGKLVPQDNEPVASSQTITLASNMQTAANPVSSALGWWDKQGLLMKGVYIVGAVALVAVIVRR